MWRDAATVTYSCCNPAHALIFAISVLVLLARSLKAEVTVESLEGVEGTGALLPDS